MTAPERAPIRIAVVGLSGAGKTTLARSLAATLAIPHVELDALHWEADWQALTRTNPLEFFRRVDAATVGPAWVADGNYRLVRELVWDRATHLVWLDYDRPVVMARVIRRTLYRALLRTRLWAGNVERWRDVLHPSHPVRWSWRTWRILRADYEALLASGEYAHLIVHRVRRPRDLPGVVRMLRDHAKP